VPIATVLVCIFTGVVGGSAVYLAQLAAPHPFAFRNIETAFMEVTAVVGGNWLYHAMGVVFLVAGIGSALTSQAGAGRLLYAMARQNVMPRRWFGRVDARGRVPAANVVVIGCIALAGSLLFSFEHAAEVLNFGAFLAFMGVNAASFRTFWLRADPGKRSVLRDAAVPVLGFLFCLGIFVSLPRPALITGGIWLALGIGFTAWRSAAKPAR
jgi:amino acid transporter